MLPKYIAQVIVSGTQALGRAFARAVREELKNSRQAAANQPQGDSSSSSSSSSSEKNSSATRHRTMANLRLGMSLQEAAQILNLSDRAKNLDVEEVEKKFKHLFDANDKSKGGSFYLQSKVYRAKMRVDEELKSRQSPPPSDNSTKVGEGSGGKSESTSTTTSP